MPKKRAGSGLIDPAALSGAMSETRYRREIRTSTAAAKGILASVLIAFEKPASKDLSRFQSRQKTMDGTHAPAGSV